MEDKILKKPYSLQNSDKTINWKFTPKGADNEYQKQLHRHNWMPLQGKSYQESHDEKYMVALTSSNGINFKYPHVLWDKRSYSNILKVLLTLHRNGFLFS